MRPKPDNAAPDRSDGPRSIVLTGTFDVRNYGDLLFPIVAQHKLAPASFIVRAASPSGKDTGWQDTYPVEPLATALFSIDDIYGVLIGGGNIIHTQPVTLPDYAAAGVADWAYPALWMGATFAAAVRGVPVAWNAPGIPYAFAPELRPLVERSLRSAKYLSVRDAASAGLMEGLAPNVNVVPDTILQLAEVWPKPTLEQPFRDILARNNVTSAERFLAVHVKSRSLQSKPGALAASLTRFCKRHDVVPAVIGIGACHGDDMICDEICAGLGIPHVNLSRPLGLREIAAAIAFSSAYVGASMHGYITAVAYGVPGAIVAFPRQPKFKGLLQLLEKEGDEALTWDEGLGKAALRLGATGWQLPANINRDIETHWRAIECALAGSLDHRFRRAQSRPAYET